MYIEMNWNGFWFWWNYPELLYFLSRNNEAIKRVTFSEALRYNKLTSSDSQKDITQAVAEEITNVIIKDLRDSLFLILINESRDISIKKQMAVALLMLQRKLHSEAKIKTNAYGSQMLSKPKGKIRQLAMHIFHPHV